jgi:hypothetical protein
MDTHAFSMKGACEGPMEIYELLGEPSIARKKEVGERINSQGSS